MNRIDATQFLTTHEEAITAADPGREDGREYGFSIVMRILAAESQCIPRETIIRDFEEEIRENQKLSGSVIEEEVSAGLSRCKEVIDRLIRAGVLLEEGNTLKPFPIRHQTT